MSQEAGQGPGRPPVDRFERAYLASNAAFNRHDFHTAFPDSIPTSSGTPWPTFPARG